MKKIILLAALAMPMTLLGQKEIKPNLLKAEKLFKEKKFDEAKAIIDVTVASQEFMVDKKGEPSRKAAEAWFFRGLIYAAIDTCKVEAFKALEAEPYKVAVESFNKAREVSKEKEKAIDFYKDDLGIPQITETQIFPVFADSYSRKAIKYYQDDKDYKKAFEYWERTMYFMPSDTSILMNAGVFFAPAAEEYDKAIGFIQTYQAKGGKSADAYIQLYSIYRDKKNDREKALAIAKEAISKFPNNTIFQEMEYESYVKLDRLPEAFLMKEKKAKEDPTDKETRYICGLIKKELGDFASARTWFEEAVKIDPKYFEANFQIADIVYTDAKKVKAEMNNLSNSKEDFKKKVELDKVYQEKLRVALPYWEVCEKLSPDEAKVLDTLYIMYQDLEMAPQMARIEKRMKALGLLD